MGGTGHNRAADNASFGIAVWLGGFAFGLVVWAAVGWALYELLRHLVA